MSLQPCHRHDLSGSTYPGEPEHFARRNILYVPKSKDDHDRRFGLYDETGRLLLGSALFHGESPFLKSQAVWSSLSRGSDHYTHLDRAVYGGALTGHFGHFITEVLNTLWWFGLHGRPDDRILFHTYMTVDDVYAIHWLSSLLSACGVKREQIIIPRAPTVFRQLLVPGQAFSEDGFAYEVYARFCNLVGRRLTQDVVASDPRPVFLSRARLQGGTNVFLNEHLLNQHLASRGFRIVFPELMSVVEQAQIFRSGGFTSGMHGSAFHAAIFAASPDALSISPSSDLRRSFPLMDAVNKARIAYMYESSVDEVAPPPNFNRAFSFRDPEALADEILACSQGRGSASGYDAILTTGSSPGPGELDQSALRWSLLFSANDEQVAVHRVSGDVLCLSPLEIGGDHAPLEVATVQGYAVIRARSQEPIPIRIPPEPRPDHLRIFHIVRSGEAFALKSLESGHFIGIPPKTVGLPGGCTAIAVSDWERFIERTSPRHGDTP